MLQTFEPSGVIARDRANAWRCSCKERGRFDPMMASFLDNLVFSAAQTCAGLRAVGCGRRGSGRHDRRGSRAQPEARPRVRRVDGRAGGAGRPGPHGPATAVDRRAEQRDAAARAGQPRLLHPRHRTARSDAGQGLPARLPADRQLAGQEPRSARADDPEGRRGNRAPAGRASSSMASSICARSI